MDLNSIKAYSVVHEERIDELDSKAYILRHNGTGARVAILENDDENKVFYIGFRTPPAESTGVMHILEHSVLCGSKNFPVKDPFIELAKGSLNTFLNAMTYPDKTVYPVASCNDKDFQNLMHVYLDAVFFPNILNSDKTFRQEGWHYELDSVDSELKINGVVYNEMKGAFSSPDDVIEREIFNSLFPDTEYSEESGGDPKVIPELTYEHYIDIYKSYYHPSNSYIYLYGNMDMVEKLDFIDREYLSNFDAHDIDSTIRSQAPFSEPVEVRKQFSVAEGEPLVENTYLSLNVAMENNLDRDEYIAFQVIDYALCSGQGAILKKALLDAGIGKDIYSIYENGIKQPYFSVVAKNSEADRKDAFIKIIDETLRQIVEEGFEKDTLRAALNGLEFRYREADFGSYPPGLMYGLQVLDSWLYDDALPFIHIAADDTFKRLRKAIDSDYYEKLVTTRLIDNNHKSVVIVEPKLDLVLEEDEKLRKKLADKLASMSDAEKEALVQSTKELLAYQEEEDDPELLKCIPLLKKEDIKKEAVKFNFEEKKIEDIITLHHKVRTNGIDYLRLLFDATNVDAELFPYLGLFKDVLGLLDTVNYSYRDLANQIHIKTGGISPTFNIYIDDYINETGKVTFEMRAKCLKGSLGDVFKLVNEVIHNTLFEDDKRLYELIAEQKSHLQSVLMQSGHSVAAARIASYHSKAGKLSDVLSGMSYYRLLEKIEPDFDNCKEEVKDKLKRILKTLFVKEGMLFDFTGDDEEYIVFANKCSEFLKTIPENSFIREKFEVQCEKLNEGFLSSSQVQFVGRGGNFLKAGFDYTGALKVLKVYLGYNYLWNNVRVKGGAYGCMSLFGRNGDCYFVSYRDPNLKATMKIFEDVPNNLENFECDERSMTQYIIGAISDLDTPFTPASRTLMELSSYMTGKTEAAFQKERDELLDCDVDTIRNMADLVRAVLDYNCVCVVGNADRIKKDSDLFDRTLNLINN